MLSQKLHIFNIPELDKIIIEIKDYCNYEINYFQKKKELIKNIEQDEKFLENSVILVQEKDLSSLRSLVDAKQINCIKKIPIKISDLIDQINTKLIQQNYSAQSSITINDYILNVNSRILKKKK